MTSLTRWLHFLTPSPGPAALTALAGGALVLGFLGGIIYGMSGRGSFAEDFGVMVGLFLPPVVAGLLMVAALVEKKLAARAGLWALAALVWIGLGVFGVLGFSADPDAGLALGLFGYCLACLPAALVCAAPAVYFGTKSSPEVRAALDQERAERAVHMLQARGDVSLGELAAEVGLPVAQADDLVEQLLQGGRVDGLLDQASGRVFTASALRAKQAQLLAIVQARGQVTFDALAAELRAPRHLLRDWVYQAVQRREFTGYLNWNEGMLYSADAEKLRASSRCPRCGGELALAGQGVIQCANCGAEIFS